MLMYWDFPPTAWGYAWGAGFACAYPRPLTELVALCATVWQKRGHTYKTRAYKMVDLPRACMGVKRGDVGVKIQAQVLNTCPPSQITHETGSVAWEPWRGSRGDHHSFLTCNLQA